MTELIAVFLLVAGLLIFDAFAAPRPSVGVIPRSAAGTGVLLLAGGVMFGGLLGLTGAWLASAIVVVILAGAVTLISNIKRTVLGEPLVFSDFALIGAVFKHPQFYVSALHRWQIAVLAAGAMLLLTVIAGLTTAAVAGRFVGLSLAGAAAVSLMIWLRQDRWKELEIAPDAERDVLRHGLTAVLLVHWRRWRRLSDPPPCEVPCIASTDGHLLIIVQCESFTDSAELFAEPALALPGLEAARAISLKSGGLQVSGFGAYTMRTEYGVIFGRSEDQLGLRRFDPFLTAKGEASWALPHRLSPDHWTSIFVHPHDLRFYGREELMPCAGFNDLIGEDSFASSPRDDGRYVADSAVSDKIFEIAAQAPGATMIYAVTIANHGPWPSAKPEGEVRNGGQYLELLRRSDAMLSRLITELPTLGRPVTLCFFGDHRPSIPNVSEPGQARHTPYIIASFEPDGTPITSDMKDEDLTPAQLHHAILDTVRLRRRKS